MQVRWSPKLTVGTSALCFLSPALGQNVWTAQEALQPVWHLQGGQARGRGVAEGKGPRFIRSQLSGSYFSRIRELGPWPPALEEGLRSMWEHCRMGGRVVILGFLKEYLNKNTGTENQHWATYCLNVTLRALKCILMLRRTSCSWKSQREKFIFRVALSCDVSVCPSVPVMPTPRPPSVWVSFFDSLALAASVSVLCLSVFCCFCCLFIHNSLGER